MGKEGEGGREGGRDAFYTGFDDDDDDDDFRWFKIQNSVLARIAVSIKSTATTTIDQLFHYVLINQSINQSTLPSHPHPPINQPINPIPPTNLKPPLPQPHPHPLRPHRPQTPHARTPPHRPRRLQHHLVRRPLLAHAPVELEQFDARIFAHVVRPQRRGGAQGGEPGWEGDGGYGWGRGFGGGVEVLGYGRDEGVPGAGVRVHEVVVVEEWGFCGWGGGRGMDVGGVGEDEVDDYAGGDVDGDPGDGVLAREFGGDLAEVLGACYYLDVGDGMLACGGDDGDCKTPNFFCGGGGHTRDLHSAPIPAYSTSPPSSSPDPPADPLGKPAQEPRTSPRRLRAATPPRISTPRTPSARES